MVELPDDTEPEVIAAIEAFTVPCRYCVPGARAQGDLVPFYFVDEGYEEYDEDEDGEPAASPLRTGSRSPGRGVDEGHVGGRPIARRLAANVRHFEQALRLLH